ncbi:hypothetical protein STAS_17333 [Striga asiatica]|uniref:Protein PEP-RELATED DEVELOPMENT ARRESTED 1, chloroplastic n=1 Tax=Striga asiatica TaxID=4170 RepID=A0A5A7Q602_STRAF|nr:hypothetical protein STAS_17333 [Striga asiatica]
MASIAVPFSAFTSTSLLKPTPLFSLTVSYSRSHLKHFPNKRAKFRPLYVAHVATADGFPMDEFSADGSVDTKGTGDEKWSAAEYEALLKGGDQVTSVLQEMVKLLEDMNMDEALEEVAVHLAAQGVIGKRVDQMESGFMMALDYMIQLAVKDEDEKRKSLLEVIKETVLSHLTKKCSPHVQVVGLLCRTPQKESRNELMRRVAAGGGVFEGKDGTKVHLPGSNLNEIANQADDLLEVVLQRCMVFKKRPVFCAVFPLEYIIVKTFLVMLNFTVGKRHNCYRVITMFVENTMESRPVVPDRKLLARLVLIREEARNMMGGGILDERNDRGLNTLPESEVNFLTKLVALRPGKTVRDMIKNVMQGKDEGADRSESEGGIAGRASVTGRKPLPVRPGMFLETVTKVNLHVSLVSAKVHQNTLQILQEIAF